MGPANGRCALAGLSCLAMLALLAAGSAVAQQPSVLRLQPSGGTASTGPVAGGPSGEKPADNAPEIQISDVALRAGLLSDDVQQIERYVRYWADKLVEANDAQDVLAARSRLMRGYGNYNNFQYQTVYAGQAATILVPLLKSADLLKQVNLGVVLSHMEQVTVQPALEVMIVSPNPALRLYGWHGYQRIETSVLAQGRDFVATMLKSLTKAAQEETCGPVMSAVFRMFYLGHERPTFILPGIYEQTRGELFEILHQSWPRICKQVLAGDIGMIQASGEALKTLRRIVAVAGSQKETPQTVVQMLLDMMWCAAKAYANADAGSPVQAASEALLRDCEGAMNTVTQLHKVPISSALGVAANERSLAVEIAVHTWVRELESAGWQVKEPALTGGSEGTRPASAPAGSSD